MAPEFHEESSRSKMAGRARSEREPSARSRAAAPVVAELAGVDMLRVMSAALRGEGTYASWVLT